MKTNLNDTLAFICVVEEGSFTAAARELRLPKTTVSRRVRGLEERLGVQLIHRTTRRLGLTEAGAAYHEHCLPIVQALTDAEDAVGQLQATPSGTLRVTSSYSLMLNLVGPLLAAFRAQCPQVRLDLVLSHTTLDLVAEKVDLALRLGPLQESNMVARRLAILPNRVWASPVYLERYGDLVHPSELKRHAALVTRVARSGSGYSWPMGRDGSVERYEVNPVIESDDPEVLKAPLFAGAGLMMATDMIMAPHAAAGLVVPVLDGWLGRCPELHAVFPRGLAQPPKLRAFVDFLVSRLAQVAA